MSSSNGLFHDRIRERHLFVSRTELTFIILCMEACSLLAALSGSAQDNATNVNIATNGSFEQEKNEAGKSNPEGWGFFGTTNTVTGAYMMEGQQVHSGKKGVCITIAKDTPTGTDAYGMWLSGFSEVKPGMAYSIEAWIRTAECTGKGAWIWILGYAEKGGEVRGAGEIKDPSLFFSGTQDWREWSTSVLIDRNVHWLRIACRLDGAGTASFDDVVVSKIE